MADTLSPAQAAALLDILSHHDMYAEAREFRHTGILEHHGPPFVTVAGQPSVTPALQILTSRFATTLPGLENLPESFWTVQVRGLLEAFAEANLSESYDKGVIGSRRTLSTAVCAILEYPVQYVYAGTPQQKKVAESYDMNDADSIYRGYSDCLNEIVYGNTLEDLLQTARETDNPGRFQPSVQAAHEYLLINLASIVHYTLIMSPKGQYLVKLADRVNRLIPYGLIKQTLRMGNAATMINAMTKIFLTKMSMTSFTNMIGLTASKNEGMNLMQQIISTVMNWDIKGFESRAAKLQKAELTDEQREALKQYPSKTYEEQTNIRKHSQNHSISIVEAILRNAKIDDQLNEDTHKQALDFLNYQLNIRDRKEIVRLLCQSYPDHLTEGVKTCVAAYDPVIREFHKAIDLSGTIGDVQSVIGDVIKIANMEKSEGHNEPEPPTVDDFVEILRKHERALYRFCHQLCANGSDLAEKYMQWAKRVAAEFKQSRKPPSSDTEDPLDGGAGDLTDGLNVLFSSLPEDQRSKILTALNTHVKFLQEMNESSRQRFVSILTQNPVPDRAKLYNSASSSAGHSPSSKASDPPTDLDPSTASTNNPLTSSTANLSINTSTSTPSSSATNLNDASNTAIATEAAPSSTPANPSNPFNLPESAPESKKPGPGAILSRWQSLLDNTPITPHTRQGKIQGGGVGTGGDVSLALDTKDKENGSKGDGHGDNGAETARAVDLEGVQPEVRFVVECLGPQFRELLAKEGCNW